MDRFDGAFEHNFYRTEEYADFCSRVAKIPLIKKTVDGQDFFTLKNKNISIDSYPPSVKEQFRKNKISYMAVYSEINNQTARPSLFEYSIFYKTTYEEAAKKYKTSFF